MPITVVSSDPPEASDPVAPADSAAPSPDASGPPGVSAPPAPDVSAAPAPPAGAVAPPESAPDASGAPQPDDDEGDTPDSIPRGVQRRIDREVRRRHEAERQAAAIQARLQMLEQGYQRPPQGPAPVPLAQQPEPREEDYPSQAEWFSAVRAWDKAQLKAELAREAAESQGRAQVVAQQRKLQTQAEAARAKYADFDQVLDRLATMPTVPALDACVHESDLGAELAYYLAQHPEDIERLNQLAQTAPLAMAREVGKLELRLSTSSNGHRPAAPVVPSTQPPPPHPVSGSGAPPPTGYREDMSQAEFDRMFPYSRRGR